MTTTYALLKVAHVVCIVMWIGPPLGMYALLLRARARGDAALQHAIARDGERVLFAEHVAFVLLLASGVAMVVATDGALWHAAWLQRKLACVAGIVAFETFDIYVAHVAMKRVLAKDVLDGDDKRGIHRLERALFVTALPVALLLIPLTLWFAVSKQ